MSRRLRILYNLGLVAASVLGTLWMLSALDRALEPLVTKTLWPGRMGLIFQPNTEDRFATHDYRCVERINSLGFRDEEVSLNKAHRFRVACIGDSFTYGWGVNLEDTWCKQLERNLQDRGVDAEVLNLGKPAAGPNEYAVIAETVIPVLKPDLVIIGVLAGDDLQQTGLPGLKGWFNAHFTNALQLVRYWRYRGYYSAPVNVVVRTEEECRAFYAKTAKELLDSMPPEQRARFDKIEEPVRQAFLEGNLNPWLLNHSTSGPDYFLNTLKPDSVGIQTRLMASALKRIKRAAARSGAALAVVSIPEGFYVNNEAYANLKRIGFAVTAEMLKTNAADKAVEDASKRNGVAFYAVSDEFRKHVDEKGLYFELDRHFTPKGNALYADAITPFVEELIRAMTK